MKISIKTFILVALVVILSACNFPQPTPSQPDGKTPTQTVEQVTTPVVVPAYTGFMVFDNEAKEFLGYDLNGKQILRIASGPGLEFPSVNSTEFSGQDVYFFSPQDKKLFRANASGVEFLENFSVENLYAFVLSPDGKQIAWSTFNSSSNPATSELWVANLDGSNARQVARYSSEQAQAFLMIPLEWNQEGKILFNRSPVGFGGYIVYGGHNSLYSYEPQTGQFTTYVPAEEMHMLCLDTYRLDLRKVVFNCGQQSTQMTVRNLNGATETQLAANSDYPIQGGARFSPGGQWLAYGAAKGDPEHEAGQLLLLPGDLSGTPQVIGTTNQGYFSVLAWLDEDTMLVAHNGSPAPFSTVLKLSRDGKQSQELAKGLFLGMMK